MTAQQAPQSEPEIRLERIAQAVTLIFADTLIAKSERGLWLYESGQPARIYLPFDDVVTGQLIRSSETSHCPWKGDACYFDVIAGERRAEKAFWWYPKAPEALRDIRDRLAFYPERFDEVTLGREAFEAHER